MNPYENDAVIDMNAGAKAATPLATGPTKGRADRCVTHHHACDCREWEHAGRIAELERDAERMLGSLRVAVLALAHASKSNKAYSSSYEHVSNAIAEVAIRYDHGANVELCGSPKRSVGESERAPG